MRSRETARSTLASTARLDLDSALPRTRESLLLKSEGEMTRPKSVYLSRPQFCEQLFSILPRLCGLKSHSARLLEQWNLYASYSIPEYLGCRINLGDTRRRFARLGGRIRLAD